MRSASAALLGLLMVTTALAGCLGDDTTGTGDDGDLADRTGWTFEDFIVHEHDHEDPEAHHESSPTMEAIAHDQLGQETAYSYLGEIDTRAGLTAVAIVGQGSTPGFVLVDTSDPSQPEVLGRAEAPQAYAVDVKLTSDGQYALLATQQVTTGRVGGTPTADSLLDGTYTARNGIMIWDISDPTDPSMVAFQPVEAYGCHMLSIAEVDGQEWVYCINQSLTAFQFVRSPTADLVPAGTYWPFGQTGTETVADKQNPTGVTPHDMTFQEDPVTGDPVLTVSHWDLGVAVLDVSMPSAPQELARWAGDGAEHYQGYVHSAQLTTVDDTRYLVVTPETLSDILPAIWVLDVTDWQSPELVAEWTNPGGHTSQGLLMTTHQFQLVDGKIYMSYNHNGIWVLDLATILANGGGAPDASEILGVHLPHTHNVTLYDRDSYPMGIPAPWDINVVDGYILTADRYTGLHVLGYTGDTPGDPALTSQA